MASEGCNGHPLGEKIKTRRTRLLELAVGLTASKAIDYLFDFALYPFVIYQLGILVGGLVMMLLSFLACLLTLWFYDWSKRDWLGIEAIKSLRGYEGDLKLGRLTGWLLRKSDPVIFLVLSLNYDPFITTAYLRHGAFNGMNRRDWRIFLGGTLVANVYWTLACFLGISLVEWAWGWLAGGRVRFLGLAGNAALMPACGTRRRA